ncbi:MAG: hypothetical protein WEB59_03185, partial [Thermoanaerobaculia bacterium]
GPAPFFTLIIALYMQQSIKWPASQAGCRRFDPGCPLQPFRSRPDVVFAMSAVVLQTLAESAQLFALREQWPAAL